MNLLARRKVGWLLWLTPLLFSCESDEILSLPQEPGDQTLSLFFEEIPLNYSLVQLDSVISSRRSNDNAHRFLAGTYRSEFFGQVQATTFAELSLDTRPEVTAEDEYDSLVLTLVNDYFYGNASQAINQSIGIYLMLDTIARRGYFRTEEIPFSALPLAEHNFMPNPKADSIADTLRIVLDNTFGRELFGLAQADSDILKSDSAFREFFPGIAIAPLMGNAAITGFDPAQLQLSLFFSTSTDTISSAYTFDVGATFNNITADRSGTPLASVTMPNQKTDAADGGFYLQAGTGLVPTLSLQPILSFIDTVERNTEAELRINQIELYIGTTSQGEGRSLPNPIAAFTFGDDFSLVVDTVQIDRFTVVPARRGLQIENGQNVRGESFISPIESTYQIVINQYTQNLINEIPNTTTEFRIQTPQLGNRLDEIVAEPDSVFAKIFYTLLE
ncbi:MAG: DUF4270 family protein [Bacteroidota bacterium]